MEAEMDYWLNQPAIEAWHPWQRDEEMLEELMHGGSLAPRNGGSYHIDGAK
jgi:hypothetical protein